VLLVLAVRWVLLVVMATRAPWADRASTVCLVAMARLDSLVMMADLATRDTEVTA